MPSIGFLAKHDNLRLDMSESPTTPQTNSRVYTFPELKVAVEARSLNEAIKKAKKQAKES